MLAPLPLLFTEYEHCKGRIPLSSSHDCALRVSNHMCQKSFYFFFFFFIIISTLFKVIATGPCQHVLARPMGNYQGCKKKKRIIYKAISIRIININVQNI